MSDAVGRNRKGASDIVQQTMKIRREDWAQLGMLLRTEGISAQELLFDSVVRLFEKYGLEAPTPPSAAKGTKR